MELLDEYYSRHKFRQPYIKYVDKAQLILRAKPGVKADYNWLNVTVEYRNEGNHPSHFQITVAGNPVVYATPDFSHFSYHHEKTISDQRWEWDQYEPNLIEWARNTAATHHAIPGREAMPLCWQMFLANYDGWFANFLPFRLIDTLHASLVADDPESRIKSISNIEEWMKGRQDKVYGAWQSIRRQLESRTYADWLANLVNAA